MFKKFFSKEVLKKYKHSDLTIVLGAGFLDIQSMKDTTHNITSVNVDLQSHNISVVIQKGTSVHQVNISTFEAQRIGFINVNSLEEYCKRI